MRGRRALVPGWVRGLSPNPLTTPTAARNILSAFRDSCLTLCSLPHPTSASFALSLVTSPSHKSDLMTGVGWIQVNRSFKSTWNHKPGCRGMGGPAFNMHWCPLNKLPCAGDIPCLQHSPLWSMYYPPPAQARSHRCSFCWQSLAVPIKTWY